MKMTFKNKSLEKFLKEKGILETFIREFYRSTSGKSKSIGSISGSFVWHATENGYDYWKQINTEFHKSKLKKEIVTIPEEGGTVTISKEAYEKFLDDSDKLEKITNLMTEIIFSPTIK